MSRKLAAEVGRRLRGAEWFRFTYEEYDEHGEIAKVEEGPLRRARGPHEIRHTIVCHAAGAEPRTDWRERGIVPPEGIWRYVGDGSAPVRVG